MVNQTESISSPQTEPGFATTFRLASRFSFWVQLGLGTVSAIALLFAMFSRNLTPEINTSGVGFGIFFAIVGILLLGVRVLWDFRYRVLGRRLQAIQPEIHPQIEDISKVLWIGLIASLVGILIAFVASEQTVGMVLAKTLAQPRGVAVYTPETMIRPLDVFVMLANVNLIGAHLCGAVTSLGLLSQVDS
jgi:Protein of unknown function (DUF3611)